MPLAKRLRLGPLAPLVLTSVTVLLIMLRILPQPHLPLLRREPVQRRQQRGLPRPQWPERHIAPRATITGQRSAKGP